MLRSISLLALAVAVAGCNGKPSQIRVPISGTVSLASGEKINGRITFVPAEDRRGPAATTGLVDGVYSFNKDNGPIPGPSRVTVKKMAPTSRVPAGNEQKGTNPVADAVAGPKSEWTTSLNIPENGPYQHDLVLER
jgi:hypothetical protein